MPIGENYQDASLDGVVDSWPATGAHYALFDGVPIEAGGDGVELADDPDIAPGYTAPDFAPSDWAAASGNAKTVSSAISFGTSTDVWAELGTHWGVVDGSGNIVFWDDLPEADVVEVNAASTAVEISPTISFQGS